MRNDPSQGLPGIGSERRCEPHTATDVLGSSTLLETASVRALSDVLAPRMALPGMRLGDAITEAKKELAGSRPDLLDVLLGWTLLGDPAMEID